MGLLIAHEVAVTYGGEQFALLGVDLTISEGSLTGLLGESGSGKSTLLRALAGLQSLEAGTVELLGQPVDSLACGERVRQIAFVAQDYQLFPHMTVEENCVHPQRKVLGISADDARGRALVLLNQLRIGRLAKRYPHQLSGGQRQRAAIARSLAMGSRLLLLDEPTSALDPHSTELLMDLLKELRSQGFTVVVSTHDMHFAAGLMDLAVILNEGKVVATYQQDGLKTLDIDELKTHMIQTGEIA